MPSYVVFLPDFAYDVDNYFDKIYIIFVKNGEKNFDRLKDEEVRTAAINELSNVVLNIKQDVLDIKIIWMEEYIK